MTISKNDNFPLQELQVLVNGEMQNTSSNDYLSDRKIILVGVPGAFTPTCHLSHVPGYVENLHKFKAKDYSVTFVSVKDPFVMKSWFDASNADGIDMIADGNCNLTNELELTMDGSAFGMGDRCKRFAMIIENGVIQSIDIEEPGAMDVSSAETQLARI